MKAYRVSFQYSEGIYCTNIARAEAVEDVEKYYSKYEWVSIKEAYEWDVEEAERKGMPIITIEHEEEEGEADMTRKIEEVREAVEARKERSAWSKGVKTYALEMVDGLSEAINGGWFEAEDLRAPKMVAKALLNGASDWNEYSWGGCSLIYDGEIAERLCTATELKRTHNGERKPNASEEWLDTQARALKQASQIVTEAIKEAVRG